MPLERLSNSVLGSEACRGLRVLGVFPKHIGIVTACSGVLISRGSWVGSRETGMSEMKTTPSPRPFVVSQLKSGVVSHLPFLPQGAVPDHGAISGICRGHKELEDLPQWMRRLLKPT